MNDAPESTIEVRRTLLRDHDALLAVGDFGPLFEAYHRHAERWDLPLDGLGVIMMHQALAAVALQLCFRVPQERAAWTVNVHHPPLNLFVTGGGEEGDLVGRYYDQDVATVGENRLYVQRSRPEGEVSRSVLSVEGLDVFEMAEAYYDKSEQLPARILELSSSEMAMALALPGVDVTWLKGLDGAAIRKLDAEGELMETRRFRFHCGCDRERIVRAMARMFHHDPEQVFEGHEEVETRCPRCGARWTVARADFDQAVAREHHGG